MKTLPDHPFPQFARDLKPPPTVLHRGKGSRHKSVRETVARNSGRTSENLTCPFQSEGKAIDNGDPRHLERKSLRGAHSAPPPKAILKRIQKRDYLGFLKVTQRVERVPCSRGLSVMSLNGVVVGK
jgi:hypothetical protein